jgi:hypothetical protein
MNSKINSIKKRFMNVCNKVINKSASGSVSSECGSSLPVTPSVKKLRLKSVLNRNTNNTLSTISTISSANTNTFKLVRTSTSSSGYCTTSTKSSVFVNLDNYFYDENFSSIKAKAQANAKAMESDIIKCLLDYQIEFSALLNQQLQSHIRPLSMLMDSKLFYEIFQNIEKIFAITEFIINAINESIFLNQDVFTSVLNVVSEYIPMIVQTYETYLKGYAHAEDCSKNSEFAAIFDEFAELHFMKNFDLLEFIDLPIKNITKFYCAFMSLQDITPASEQHDFERINYICGQLKFLIGPSSDTSLDLDDLESVCTSKSSLPDDFVDENGQKYYFV